MQLLVEQISKLTENQNVLAKKIDGLTENKPNSDTIRPNQTLNTEQQGVQDAIVNYSRALREGGLGGGKWGS